MNYMANAPQMQSQMNQQSERAGKNSVASNLSGSTQHGEDNFSESGNEQTKPQRSKKKASSAKSTNKNNARKAEETPSKGPNKKQKGNNGTAKMQMQMEPPDDDSEDDEELPQFNEHGRKLTDEEKRKNFLERNRIAALKCRQRKKQWLANLQQKVEIFTTENDALAGTVTQLREEIVGLKTLLLAHKDCPVSQAQGISGMAMQNIAGEPQQYGHYGMGMQGMPQHGMPQANMQRR